MVQSHFGLLSAGSTKDEVGTTTTKIRRRSQAPGPSPVVGVLPSSVCFSVVVSLAVVETFVVYMSSSSVHLSVVGFLAVVETCFGDISQLSVVPFHAAVETFVVGVLPPSVVRFHAVVETFVVDVSSTSVPLSVVGLHAAVEIGFGDTS